ncbi:nicotinate phosphoribosyltransferase [Cnuella takakiae]|uniref:Nicotinate phosphoribosyltransferase n=1 Tax=Cnuella takakiae TaxID=1302690 RepID=A0A1M5HJG1_9BACT|nr:nicotinate phosphoribosyltransferase [Cnuella takakiae]OLY92889.1 nicotinate phosphoribosyltransferase [Cnuella takakiae]SHG15962.1 nicotinate phosphoribosyltransferase [Cnuella takakiae]
MFAQLPSILDNDFYKFTMQQGVLKLFPRARARYQFINRGKHVFPEGFAEALRASVNAMAQLRLSAAEKAFFAKACPYLDPVYFDFLQGYCYDPSEVVIRQEAGELTVNVEGLWYRTILWEVPLLCLISENFYLLQQQEGEDAEAIAAKASAKLNAFEHLGVTIADFGTRRRHSYRVQDLVVRTLAAQAGQTFVGSSNVHLAMKYQTKPIGTHAHEWFMFHGAQFGFKMANTIALENWVQVYRGDLGIALSDTYTTAEFFEIFDKKFAKLFDGVRHDSGDPLEFADSTIAHYEKLGIDAKTKTIIFSDSLNTEKVSRIVAHCKGRIGMSFGIGTNLTNDVGLKPMNIVIKMTEACPEGEGWIPVVKLSDERGKYTGSAEYIALAKAVLQIKD